MIIMKGTRVETVNFGWCEAITDIYMIEGKKARGGWIDVKFDNTGFVRTKVIVDFFKQGCVRDGSVPIVVEVGQIYHTNLSGDIEVVGGDKNINIQIKFLNTGSLYKVQKDAMLTGFCKDQPTVSAKIEKEIKETKERVQVAKLKATIRKDTLNEKKLQSILKKEAKQQREKERKEYLALSLIEKEANNKELIRQALELDFVVLDQTTCSDGILNIDFKDREGNWVLRYVDQSTRKFVQTRLGRLHNNVTQRCSKDSALQKVHNKAYDGVTLSDLFKDQNSFCNWVVQQVGWGFGYHLDKDLLVENNRHYSEDTCCFLPRVINASINSKGKVNVQKRIGYFSAMSSAYSQGINIGKYDTMEEADQACKDFKQARISRLAELYKQNLDRRAYEKLLTLIDKSH
jgi:hypothetical protein